MESAIGPTGPGRAVVIRNDRAPQGISVVTLGATGAVDLSSVRMENGEWYAFRFEGREIFARVHFDASTGFLELTEVPNPYVCADCGKGYQEGDHEWKEGPGTHSFRQRGAD